MLSSRMILILFGAILCISTCTVFADDWGDAVVLSDIGHASWQLKSLVFKRHTRAKVLTDDGIEKVDHVSILRRHYDELYDLKTKIIRSTGDTIQVDKEFATETREGPWLITHLHFPDVHTGDVIDYSYNIELYGGLDKLGPEAPLFYAMRIGGGLSYSMNRLLNEIERDSNSGRPVNRFTSLPTWFFDHEVYTLRSELRLELGAETDFAYCTVNLLAEEGEPTYKPGPFLTRVKNYTWVLENLKPYVVKDDSYLTTANRKTVYFNILSTRGANKLKKENYTNDYWSNIGNGFEGFLKYYCKIPRSLKKKVKELTTDITDDHVKAEAILQYVTREMKPQSYIFGLYPTHYNLKGLVKEKVGMPFEINILLCEMLKLAGLEAWPVLISTSDKPSFRDWGQFNHAIVLAVLDGVSIVLDGCYSGCKPGSLPPFSLVPDGLLVGENKLGFVQISANKCNSTY